MKDKKLLIQQEPIGEFCYPFAELLLRKLKELKRKENLFQKNSASSSFTAIGKIVMQNLAIQLNTDLLLLKIQTCSLTHTRLLQRLMSSWLSSKNR